MELDITMGGVGILIARGGSSIRGSSVSVNDFEV